MYSEENFNHHFRSVSYQNATKILYTKLANIRSVVENSSIYRKLFILVKTVVDLVGKLFPDGTLVREHHSHRSRGNLATYAWTMFKKKNRTRRKSAGIWGECEKLNIDSGSSPGPVRRQKVTHCLTNYTPILVF